MFLCFQNIGATVCKNRESRVSCENFNFLIFCPKDPLGKLFSKVAFKISKDFYFSRNREKLKLAVEGRRVALTAIESDRKSCIFSALANKIGKQVDLAVMIYCRTAFGLYRELKIFSKTLLLSGKLSLRIQSLVMVVRDKKFLAFFRETYLPGYTFFLHSF